MYIYIYVVKLFQYFAMKKNKPPLQMCVKNCGVINNILLTKNTNFPPSKSALYGTLVYFRPCEMAGDTRTCLC